MQQRSIVQLLARMSRALRIITLIVLLQANITPGLPAPVASAQPADADVQSSAAERPTPAAVAGPAVAASMSVGLLQDTNRNRRADAGETLRYTAIVSNTGGADATSTSFNAQLDPYTTLIPGSLRISPLAFADSYNTLRDTALNVAAPGLLSNDTGTPVPTVTPFTGPTTAGGTVTVRGDGSFTYTPPAGYAGADGFGYTIGNALGSDNASVTIEVRTTPTATNDSYNVVKDTPRVVAAPGVLANDTGFPTPTVTPFSGATAAGGNVVVSADGGFTYTPPAGYTGADSFGYTATNPAGSATATVALSVGNGPLALDDPGYTTPIDTALNVPAGVGPPADLLQNDVLGTPAATLVSFGGGSLSGTVTDHAAGTTATFGAGGALTVNADGSFSFTPVPKFTGNFSFVYRVSNIFGTSDAQVTIAVQEAPAITSANSTTFTVGTAGSFTVTTTGFPIPVLSESGTLPAGVTFVDNGDGTAALAGTPAQGSGGVYPLTLTAANGVLPNATQSFTLTVNQAPAITSANSATFTVGSAGSFTITTTGFPVAAISQTGTLPAGVTFVDNGDGTATLSGTPAVNTGGTYSLTLTAANGVLPNATQSFTLTVNQAPAITSTNSVTFTVGVAGSFTVTTTGFPLVVLAETGALPTGVTFVDNGDGTATLSGTPAQATGGVYPLTLTATNGVLPNATQSFTLTVNQAPAITSASSATFTVGSAGSFTVTTTGFPVAAISQTGTLPAGVTFVDNGDGTATLSGTPGAASGGTYSLTLTAANGVLPNATQSFKLTVNQAPAITSTNSVTFTVGNAGSFTVTTTGFPLVALAETGALPAGVTFVDNANGTATLSGTPGVGTQGVYKLTLIAANGVAPNASQSFTLTVGQVPAITSANSTTFTVGTAGSFTVTTTGFPTPALNESGALPAGVTFVDNGDGTATLSGTPGAASGGTYSLALTAANGVLPNATQSFTLTVNQAPAITSANSATFPIGATSVFTVTTTGFPVPTITRGGASLPAGVTFVDNGDGMATLSGSPSAASGGTYTLSFTAANGVLPNATQSFTLTINQAPAITSANSATFTVGTAGSFTVTTTGFPAPALNESGALPAGVTFVDNGDGTATLSGTPAQATGGVYPLTLTATNGVLPNATQSFTLTVNQAPAITSANSATFTVGTAGSFTVTTTGFPAPALNESGALPAGVTFVDNGDGTATLSGTPGAASGGTYSLTLTAANGVLPNATQSFTLTINQAPAITSANSATFTVGTAGSFTVTTTGFPVATIGQTGALPTGVTFVDNGDGTATLSGTPAANTGGVYPLTLTAANGALPNATQSFTLTINQAPAITSTNSVAFPIGATNSFTVTTTGFPAATLAATGVLPTGITFTDNGNGTATLAGTPGAGTAGAYPLTLSASNGVLPDASQNFTLNVTCPVITVTPAAGALPSGTYGTAYSQIFNVSGGAGPYTFAVSTGALPSGLSLSAGGALAGAPTDTGSFSFTAQATDTLGCQGSTAYSLTVRPNAQPETYSGAVGNTQLVVGAAVPTTPNVFVAGDVLANDAGPISLAAGPASIAAANGSVQMSADGTFIYTPNVGFSGPSDTFTYTLTDGNGATNTATVTINLSNRVWYVRNNAAAGDGRSNTPFNTLAAAATASSANDYIFVHRGDGTTTGMNAGITLKSGQLLIGEGVALVVGGNTLLAAGSRPLIGNSGGAGITLSTNNTVRGLDIGSTSAAAMSGSNFGTLTLDTVTINTGNAALSLTTGTANATFTSVTSTGGTNNISLTGVAGTLNLGSGALSGATSDAFVVSGGTAAITYGGTINNTTAQSVNIASKTSGSVTFNGAVSGSGKGVLLSGNTGSTVNFAGGINLNTGANTAFSASGGGTVNATQNNSSIVNTISTTTGTALNVVNTTIGASGLTFRSISSNGGTSNGIILDTTGASGGLTVTGDGTNTSVGGNSSGGTIANKSGADLSFATQGTGIYLNNTSNVVLRRMTINGTNQNYGIRGTLVSGFTLEYSTVGGSNGTNFNSAPYNSGEGSIYFGDTATNGLSSSGTFTNNNISGGAWRNVSIINTANGASTTTLTFKGNTFGLNGSLPTGNQSLAVENRGTATINSMVGGTLAGEGNIFTGSPGDLVNFSGQSGSTMDVVMTNNALSNNHAGNIIGGGGLTLATAGTMSFSVQGNTMRDANGSAVTLFKASATSGTPSLSGIFSNNTIGVAGVTDSGSKTGNGIFVSAGGTGTMSFTIANNQIHQIYGNFHISADNTGGSYAANFTVTGNTFDTPGAGNAGAIGMTNGSPTSTDTVNVCAKIGGSTAAEKNTLNFSGGTAIYVGSSGAASGHTFNLPGYAGGANLANVQNFIQGNNAGLFTTSAYADPPATEAAFTGVGTGCGTPLLAAGGEGPGAGGITQAELAPVAAAAIARWEASGLSASERAKLAAVSFSLANLEPGHLGDAGDAQVRIDRDAAGWGWFVDPTPADDAEFADRVAATELSTEANSAASKGMDLLTTVMHELGHMLGRDDLPAAEHSHDLMTAELPIGTRRLPAASAPVRAGISPARVSDIVTADIGTLPAGKKVVITFDVTIASPLPGSVSKITSQATVSGSNFADVLSDDPSQPGSADPTSILLGLRSIYLPMIGAAPVQQPLPDLIVDRIVATSSGIQVVIRNVGAAPVTEAFWLDVYINPRAAPTRVNQIWQSLGSQGMVWGVTQAALPLAPGATLTLSIGDQFYQPALSSFSVPLAAGTKIYAQVDSANAATTYGAVLETHERAGGPYNNISGPTILTTALQPSVLPSILAAPSDSGLPRRAK